MTLEASPATSDRRLKTICRDAQLTSESFERASTQSDRATAANDPPRPAPRRPGPDPLRHRSRLNAKFTNPGESSNEMSKRVELTTSRVTLVSLCLVCDVQLSIDAPCPRRQHPLICRLNGRHPGVRTVSGVPSRPSLVDDLGFDRLLSDVIFIINYNASRPLQLEHSSAGRRQLLERLDAAVGLERDGRRMDRL